MDIRHAEVSVEQLIDAHGLGVVIELIAGVCSAKADHIQSSYAIDSRTAAEVERTWARAATVARRAVRSITDLGL